MLRQELIRPEAINHTGKAQQRHVQDEQELSNRIDHLVPLELDRGAPEINV